MLKRLKFAATSEGCNAEQKSLLEETLDADQAAVAAEIEALLPSMPTATSASPGARSCRPTCRGARSAMRRKTPTCGCGQPMRRIGEDAAETLDYQPGVLSVERHIPCKIVQAPVAPHFIDKGLPTTALLA